MNNNSIKSGSQEKATDLLARTPVVCLIALICCSLWGSAFPAIKVGYRIFAIEASDTAGQILFAGARFFLAGVLTILIGSALQKRILLPKLCELPQVAVLAMLQTILQYMLFYIGLSQTTGVKSSIINATNVFFSVLVAVFLFRQESLTLSKVLGCLLGFAGVVLVNLDGAGLDGGFRISGEGCILLSAVANAFSSNALKRFSKDHDPVMLSGYQFLLGGFVMILAGVATGGRITFDEPADILLLIYMAMISAVAYSLWGILLRHNPVSKVAVFGFITPIFGVLFSALFLGETDALGLTALIALLLVSGGIYLVNVQKT